MSEDSINLRSLFVASLPKSGTIRSRTFFHVFSELLRGNMEATALGTTATGEMPCEELGAGFYVEHSIYMDLEFLEGAEFDQWRELPLADLSYNAGFELCRSRYEQEKKLGRAPKIVHLFRNPLDQAISIYHNKCALKSIQEEGGYRDACGVWRTLEFSTLFRELYLPLWIKVHYPYRVANERRPEEVHLITFEQLMADPVTCYAEMMKFFGIPLTREQHDLLTEAVCRTEKEQIRKIEDAHSESFLDIGQGNRRLDAGWRHVRSGKIGQWREELKEGDIEFAANLLSQFGISLESAITEPQK